MLKPADPRPRPQDDRPIGELVGRLVDEGKAYAQAEIGVAKAVASAKATRLKLPAILLGAALLIAQAAVTVLAVALFLALLALIGPLLAGIAAFAIFAGIAAGLTWGAIGILRREL